MSDRPQIDVKNVLANVTPADASSDYATMLMDRLIYGTSFSLGKVVSAKRARKLRKRGEPIHATDRTSTGKARYIWAQRIHPMKVYNFDVAVPDAAAIRALP